MGDKQETPQIDQEALNLQCNRSIKILGNRFLVYVSVSPWLICDFIMIRAMKSNETYDNAPHDACRVDQQRTTAHD